MFTVYSKCGIMQKKSIVLKIFTQIRIPFILLFET